MINPFDKTFFHFLFGFALILLVSLSLLFFTEAYKDAMDGKEVALGIEGLK